MFFSALASAIKRFGLTAVAVSIVTCIGMYVMLGSLSVMSAAAVAAVSFAAILVVGLPLEYHKRSR